MNVKAWLNDINDKTIDNVTFNNELERFFYYASLDLKKLNDQNLMPVINFNTIDVTFQGPVKFNDVVAASGDYRGIGIKSLTSLMIGISLGRTDYLFSNNWIKENYLLYKDLLPAKDERYYSAVINEDKAIYYCDYKSNPKIIPLRQEENSDFLFSNQTVKTKSTSAGKAFGEKPEKSLEQKAAFVSGILLSAFIVLILLIILTIYFTFFY